MPWPSFSWNANSLKNVISVATIRVEVWAAHHADRESRKVTEGQFTFVAIDENRRTRVVPRTS